MYYAFPFTKYATVTIQQRVQEIKSNSSGYYKKHLGVSSSSSSSRKEEKKNLLVPYPLLVNPNITFFCLTWEDDFDVDLWWTHHPEWKENIMASNTTHSCFDRITEENRLEFVRKVYDVQWHGNCSLAKQRYIINSGYGASFGTVLKAFLSTMLLTNFSKPFIMTKHWDGAYWLYSTKDNSSWAYCEAHDMTCYLLPLSNCRPDYEHYNTSHRGHRYRQDDFPGVGSRPTVMSWLRRYMNRYNKITRKKVIDTLYNEYPSAPEYNCTVMHVRRGDSGLPRPPFRRYAAVSEYLEVGNVKPGDNIVLLTDDDTTIQEVEQYHPGYNWIYPRRRRNQAARDGFDGHIPSKDPASDFIAILSELRLASRCTKLVHGKSGFVALIMEAMEDAGTNFTTFYLNTAVSKGEARSGKMGTGKARGDNMIKMIHEQMKNHTSNSTAVR